MLLLVYVFTIVFVIILECIPSAYKKFVVKQRAILRQQQPHTSRVSRVS